MPMTRVHRRADLVAHRRQERALGLVGGLGGRTCLALALRDAQLLERAQDDGADKDERNRRRAQDARPVGELERAGVDRHEVADQAPQQVRPPDHRVQREEQRRPPRRRDVRAATRATTPRSRRPRRGSTRRRKTTIGATVPEAVDLPQRDEQQEQHARDDHPAVPARCALAHLQQLRRGQER